MEQTLNALFDAEADRFCRVQRYEHTGDRDRVQWIRVPVTMNGNCTPRRTNLEDDNAEKFAIRNGDQRGHSSVAMSREETLVERFLADLPGLAERRHHRSAVAHAESPLP